MSILDDFLGPDQSALPSRSALRGVTEDILQRQRGAESGNRHRNPDGSLIRNPTSGALGISQIMPATGVDPGFGIAPLRDQSEAEYERFQRDYMTAMLNRYGDTYKALAAYNWGPGNFDKVADDPNWMDRVPDETRKYVAKIAGVPQDVQAAVQSTVEPKQPRQSLLGQSAPDLAPPDEYTGLDLQGSKTRAQQLRERVAARRGASATAEPDTSLLDDFMSAGFGAPKSPEGDVTWGDYGRALQSGTAQFGQMAAGAGEWLGSRIDAIDKNLNGGQGQGVLSLASEDARRYFGALSQEYAGMMSPEAQSRLSREILTLDPTKTMWQGGPGEFLSSAALKFTQSAPSTFIPLLGFPILSRVGLGTIAGTSYGVSEGILSLGGVQAQIADEIEKASPEDLAKSQRYQQLLAETGDDAAAREALKQEATAVAPLLAGIAVGAVSAVAGKYLEPLFVEGRTAIQRGIRGAASEASQEFAQSGFEQLAQNAAAQVYDSSRELMQDVWEQAAQGAVIGGPAGGGFAVVLGKGPQAEPEAPPPPAPPPTDLDEITGLPKRNEYVAAPPTPFQETDPNYLAEFDPKADYMPPAPPAAGKQYGSGKYANLRPGEQARAAEEAGLDFNKRADYLGQQTKGFAGVPEYQVRTEDQLTFDPLNGAPELQPKALPAPSPFEPVDSAKAMNRPPAPAPTEQQRLDVLDWGALGQDNERPAPAVDTSIPEGYNQRLDQPDMFAAPAPAAAPRPELLKPVTRTSVQTTGREAVRMTPDGQVIERVPLKNRSSERRLLRQWEREFPDQLVRVAPVVQRTAQTQLVPSGEFAPDAPSAEPLTDLRAQVASMQRGEREGVYLSADNVARLKQTGQYVPLTNGVTPLENFDGKGGVMLFRDRAGAEKGLELARYAMKGGIPDADAQQEVIGAITGAGLGKPLDTDIVVQRLDDDGNVVQERLVADEAEADAVSAQWGDKSRIVSAKFAIRRRNQLIAREQAMLAAEQTQRTQQKLEKAKEVRNVERQRGVGKLLNPRDIIFADDTAPETVKLYEQIFNEAVAAELKQRAAATVSDRLKARAELTDATERAEALLALNPYTSQAAARTKQAKAEAPKVAAVEARKAEDIDKRRDVREEERQLREQKRIERGEKTSLVRWAGAAAWLKVQNLSPKAKAQFETLWNMLNPRSEASLAPETATTAREIRELMVQYISDYRAALDTIRTDAPKGSRRRTKLDKAYSDLGRISETLSKLGASALTEQAVPRAAFTATYRLLRHINLAGQYGVAAEVGRDAVLAGVDGGPATFLDALKEATVTRDAPNVDYTEDELKLLDTASLNRLYLKALGRINTRISDGRRAAMVEAIINASETTKGKSMRSTDLTAKLKGGKFFTYYDLVRLYREVMRPADTLTEVTTSSVSPYKRGDKGAAVQTSRRVSRGPLVPLPPMKPISNFLADKEPSEKIKQILRVQAKEESARWGISRRTKTGGLTRSSEGGGRQETLADTEALDKLVATAAGKDKKAAAVAVGKLRDEYERIIGKAPKASSTPKGMSIAIKRAMRQPAAAKTKSRYNTKSLYDRTVPRDVMEGSEKVKKEHAKKHADAVKALSLATAKAKLMLDDPKAWSVKGVQVENATAAKLFLKWLVQYADMHLNVQGQSSGAIKDMTKVADDLAALRDMKPEQLVKHLGNLYDAEAREQVTATAKSDPTVLGDLRNPTTRAKWNFYSAERLRKAITSMRRLSATFDRAYIEKQRAAALKSGDPEAIERANDLQEMSWSENQYWRNHILPVLQNYADSLLLQSDSSYARYQPTQAQREMIEWAMKDMREDPRYAAIDELLRGFGFYDKVEVRRTTRRTKVETRTFANVVERDKWMAAQHEKDPTLEIQTTDSTDSGPITATVFKHTPVETVVGEPGVVATRRYKRRFGSKERESVGALTGLVNLEGRDVGLSEQSRVEAAKRVEAVQGAELDNPRLVNALVSAWDINNAVMKFVAIVQNRFSSKQSIIEAEQRLVRDLKTISDLYPTTPGQARVSLFKTVSAPAGMYRLTYPHNMQEVNFRLFGPRLAKGTVKVAEVRETVKNLWKKVELSEDIANEAKRRAKARGEDITALNLDLTNYTTQYRQASAAEWDGADAIQGALKSRGGESTYREVLGALASKIGKDHAYAPLIKKLLSLQAHHTTRIVVDDSIDQAGNFTVGADGVPIIRINLAAHSGNPAQLIHTLLHESVHAATTAALVGSPLFGNRLLLQAMDQLRIAAKARINPEVTGETAFQNAFEFVTEAFTNPELQAELKKIKLAEIDKTIWQKFVGLIRELLNIEPQGETMLDAVISLESNLFSETAVDKRMMRVVKALVRQNLDRPTVEAVQAAFDNIANNSEAMERAREKGAAALDRAGEATSEFALSAQTMRQILKRYAAMFNDAKGNAMRRFGEAFFARVADSQRMLMGDAKGLLPDGSKSPAALSNDWSEIISKSKAQARILSEVMTEATRNRMHPDKDLTDPAHAHLPQTQKIQETHAKLRSEWNKLTPATQKFYKAVENYYRSTLKLESDLMALTAIRTYMADHKEWEGKFNYTEKDIDAKKLNTKEGLDREFGDAISDEGKALILKMANIPAMHEGPYFPLKRYGKFVVSARKKLETRTFATAKERADWAKVKQAEDPTLELRYSGSAKEGPITITVYETEMRQSETRTEANKDQQELEAKYGKYDKDTEEGASSVLLKASMFETQAAIPSNAALNTLLGKLQDNAAAQNAIKDFYLRSIHDASFRKNQIRRKNTAGVDPTIQHRAFADYAKSASYYIAQLRFGHKMATAMQDMGKLARHYTDDQYGTAVKAGKVVAELQLRDKMASSPYEVGKWVRKSVEFTQFMMLTSPSYWLINATQPWMITAPWLASQMKGNTGAALAALTKAQKLIAHPILEQTLSSAAGVRAFFDRRSAESAYSVLQQVEEQIRQKGGARATEYIEMLETLKRESIIDMSMQSEIRDIANGEESTFWNRMMDASRIMAHVTEVNNRIMTAIAAYDLARDKGIPESSATEFARKAVAETQYDYSAANKARLFSAQAGGWRPLVFQFMQYTQHTYALLIEAFQKSVKGSSPEERANARRLLGGILLTHMMAGGVMGATIQPLKWAIGMLLAAIPGLGDDEDETFDNVASGATYDRFMREVLASVFGDTAGEVLSGGIPRAFGADVSSRMTLGQLYFVDLNPETAETMVGSAAMSFAGPLVNIAGNEWRAIKYLREGEYLKAAEMTTPKMVRDFMRMARYANEGVTDSTGKVILDSEQLSPLALFWQAIGVSPSTVAEMYARNQVVKDAQKYGNEKKAEILRRYRNADSAAERRAVARERAELRRKYGIDISYADLIRSRQGKLKREKQIQRYGATLSPRDRRYAEEGEIYNVGEEE